MIPKPSNIDDRTAFRALITLTVGSLMLVSPAAAQNAGGFCSSQLSNIFNALMQLALYGGFAMAVLSYVGTSALMGMPGVSQGQEQNLKEVQSSAIRNGIKIFAVPMIIVAIDSITGNSLPLVSCMNLTPFI
jgi:hypothetical protein